MPASFDEQHGVDQEIHVARPAPAEAAADQQVMQLDLVAADAQHLGGRLLGVGLALGADPDFGRVARGRNRRDRIQRLHLRVVGVVAEVLGLHRGRRLGQLRPGVAGLEPVAAVDRWGRGPPR